MVEGSTWRDSGVGKWHSGWGSSSDWNGTGCRRTGVSGATWGGSSGSSNSGAGGWGANLNQSSIASRDTDNIQTVEHWQSQPTHDEPWPGRFAGSPLLAGFEEERQRCNGRGGTFLDFLRLLPNKDWVPFGSFELEPHQGVFGAPGGTAVEFYLKPSLMPVGGFFGWKAHPIYQKDLAFIKKDNLHEIRLNKEIATRWTAASLLEFAEVRSAEFDVANVITTVHRIAKASDRWNVKRDPRLRQVIAQAVDILQDPERRGTARDVAKTQWAMGRLKHTDRAVQERLSGEVMRRLGDLQPQGLSNIMWSYAYIGAPPRPVLHAVVATFREQLQVCDPQALGNVSWAFAKLVIVNVPMLEEMSLEAIKRAEGFDPQGLANLAWAFATLQQEDAGLFDCLGDVLAKDPSRWQPQNMANLLWAYAKMLITHPRLLDAVAEETISTVDNWGYQGLANITWAYAKLGCSNYRRFFDRVATAVMQKITTFTPQNTVNIAWAYAKLGLAKADLMDSIAEDVIAKAKDFSPQHCSNTAWAFGTAGVLNERMMECLADAVDRRVSEFNGQDLANVAWACAKLVWTHNALCDTISRDVAAKVSSFTPQNIAITAWSYGCLAVTSEPMMAAIAEDFPRRVGDFGPQGLSNLAHGFAKQTVRDALAMEAIAGETAKTIKSFTNQEFSATTWAFAKLGFSPQVFVDAVVEEMKKRISALLPQDLAMLAWSFAHFDGNRAKMGLEDISWEVLRQAPQLGPQDLTNICWAYATAGFENAMMMEALAQEVVKKVANFTAQDLSNTAWAFARLGLAQGDMFDAISAEVTKKVAVLLPQNLSIISWAFAKLGLVNDAMMEAIATETITKIDDFDGQGIGNVMWSFGVLGLRHHWSTAEAVVRRALVMIDDLTTQELSNIAWGLSLLQHTSLLDRFLPHAITRYTDIVGAADGASWTDFTNVSAQHARDDFAGSRALDEKYRAGVLEPVLASLLALRRGGGSDSIQAELEETQCTIDTVGAPHFGFVYTREALARLGFGCRDDAAWTREARARCREELGEWQIPCAHSIVAFASWDLRSRGRSSAPFVEPGRVFRSGWSEGVSEEVKKLLHPFTQIIKRDMHAERVALLYIVDTMIALDADNVDPSEYVAVMGSYRGVVSLYLSHFPSISSLGVFCQFARWCPHVQLGVEYDDAWATCCGVPRFESCWTAASGG